MKWVQDNVVCKYQRINYIFQATLYVVLFNQTSAYINNFSTQNSDSRWYSNVGDKWEESSKIQVVCSYSLLVNR